MHRQHKHLISIFVTLSLFLGIAGAVAPYPQHRADAVEYQPLNNKRPKDYAIIRKDSVWHVFAIYCTIGNSSCQNPYPGLMHLTSTDLTTWTEVGYVIPPGTAGAWDDGQTWAPSVVEKDGTYYMYYAGTHRNGSNVDEQKIGLATSTDLYTWTKSPSNPVVNCDNFSWAYWDPTTYLGIDCRDPYVMWDSIEQQWVMFFSARTMDDGTSPPWIDKPTVVGISTSDDLVTWREYGSIPNTRDYTTESAHVIEHAGTYYMFMTDNGGGGTSLKYLTSSNLYTGWGTQTVPPGVGANEYASETISDDGRDYFTRISNNNVTFDFDDLKWTGSPFTIQEIAYASVGDFIWNDADGDGIQDGGESGIDNVTVKLYHDNGDNLFDPVTDDLYATKVSGDDPMTFGTQHGYYKFSTILPGTYWLSIDPTNYNSGNALSGKISTTSNSVIGLTLTDSQSNLTQDIGFVSMDTTYRLTTGANFSVDAGLTLSSGRVAPTQASVSASPTWWNSDWLYRKQITINAVSQTLDTTKTVTIDGGLASLVTAGKLQADYDDLRLVYWNGSSNVEVQLDIVDASTQRFKVQASISAGGSNSNYYLYYGNSAALKKPTNLSQVYDYYSSFNAADGTSYGSWAESGGSNWNISGNRWVQSTVNTSDYYSRDTSKVVDLSQNYAEEVSLKIVSGQIGGISLIRPDAITEDKYWFNVDAVNDRTQFYSYQYGHLGSDPTITINTGTDYRYRVEFIYLGSSLRQFRDYINGTQQHSYLLSSAFDIWDSATYPSNLKNTTFGLNTYNGNISFNDVKGWQLHDGTTSFGSEVPLDPTVTATLQPVAGQAVSFTKLEQFAASTLSQGGTVKFVLSNDAGTSWIYWNGSAWTTSNSSVAQANTVSEINAQVNTFPTGSGSFLWKAVVSSTTSTYPMVLHVAIGSNIKPTTPTLTSPNNSVSLSIFNPTLQFSSTDGDSDSLQYEIQIDTVNTFDSLNLQSIIQASSQTGWSGQDANSNTRYASGTGASFTIQNVLGNGTYFWRVRSIDPSGSNTVSAFSSTRSMTTPAAHVLTNITATESSSSSMTVSWTTSNLGTSKVEFGPTTLYGTTLDQADSSTSHSVLITNLDPAITYHYRVYSTDIYAQTTVSADRTFAFDGNGQSMTIGEPTTEATDSTAVTIRWTSSLPGNALVHYGLSESYGNSTGNSSSTTDHQVTVHGLIPGKTYHYRVTTTNGSQSVSSDDATFTTPASNTISSIQVSHRTSTSVTINWNTEQASTGRILFGTSAAYGNEVTSSVNTTLHAYTLMGLKPSTTYHFRIIASGDANAVTSDQVFTTLRIPKGRAVPPAILSVIKTPGVSRSITITGLARGESSVAIFVDGQLRRRLTVGGSSSMNKLFVTQIRSSLLTNGQHIITAQATDSVGRTSIIRQRFVIDF